MAPAWIELSPVMPRSTTLGALGHPSRRAGPKSWSKPGSSGGMGGTINVTHFEMEEGSDGEQVGVTCKQLYCHPRGSLWPFKTLHHLTPA